MKENLFHAKLTADKEIRELFESDAETSGEYAQELKAEIDALRERLDRFEAAYHVYHGFHKKGLEQWWDIAEATYKAAKKEARDGNLDVALALFKDASDHGCVEAKVALAKAYVYGEYGIKRKPELGLTLLREAADQGDGAACLLFTTIHDDYPRLVGPDVALQMCQKAAAMDYPPALKRLKKPFDRSEETTKLLARKEAGEKGVAFWLSTRGDLPAKDRENYFYEAVREEDPMAELEMGFDLLRQNDVEGAKSYFQKAVDHGNGPACFALIDVLLQGRAPFWKGPDLPDVNDPMCQQELALVKRAAEIGNSRGLCVLGRSYVRGYMVEKDYEQAKPLLEKALAQEEEDVAPQMLGEIYEHTEGKGTAQKAVDYYFISANHGNLASMVALKRIYENGLREVEPDPRKAMYYTSLCTGYRW